MKPPLTLEKFIAIAESVEFVEIEKPLDCIGLKDIVKESDFNDFRLAFKSTGQLQLF